MPPLAPAMPPLAIVDLTGKTIPLPVGGTNGSGTPIPVNTGTPVPIPTPP